MVHIDRPFSCQANLPVVGIIYFDQVPKQLNGRFQINHNYYQAVYVFLSCYVHTYPFSLTQLADFKAGTGDSLHLMSVAVKYCTGFLALAIKGFISVVDCQITPVPDDVKAIIQKWAYVISKGVSGS